MFGLCRWRSSHRRCRRRRRQQQRRRCDEKKTEKMHVWIIKMLL